MNRREFIGVMGGVIFAPSLPAIVGGDDRLPVMVAKEGGDVFELDWFRAAQLEDGPYTGEARYRINDGRWRRILGGVEECNDHYTFRIQGWNLTWPKMSST